ncbi:hypothetical protein MIND_00813900 [Mycena indigotica]|uniref:RRM Nup35-type domain-containing protein n=1 Tax=Mycena indigotica TaxID=2126181 RepID=A0A8H6VYN9_9AGAR|nr:uncharacterized protein MIND_00813900 [Mycena indigotica]KAF7298667.1 hypothetical protein MIND_00813900 [Mycena indigotica]
MPSPFSVAGMASTSTSHLNNPNLNSWGASSTSAQHAPLGNSFSDSLSMSQSRTHYQPGYIMGASQSGGSPTGGNQRVDEPPVVQTKAKMNHAFSRGGGRSDSDFGGMESMFQSSRQRQALADEDAPPMSSVNDIPTEMYADSSFQPRTSTFGASAFGRPRPKPQTTTTTSQSPSLYIIVFGYPADKYSLTVEYFKSLGDASDADPHAEIINCFKIGYRDPADAMRAVRKNGEVLGGSWMVGAKWADPAAAEALLSQATARFSSPEPQPSTSGSMLMAVDSPSPTPPPHSFNSHTPMVGTPIKLAPSSSAFRRGVPNAPSKPATPVPQAAPTLPPAPGQASPSKGMLGQVSDMIFGW